MSCIVRLSGCGIAVASLWHRSPGEGGPGERVVAPGVPGAWFPGPGRWTKWSRHLLPGPATQARREFLSTFRNLYTTANDRTKITEYKERFQGTQRDLKAVLEEMELNEDINQGGIMDEIIKSRKIEDGKRARAEREAERRAEIEAANKKLDADREEFKRINEQYAAQQSP